MNKTTVYRVSKDTGIAASTLSDWKSGRSVPKLDKIKLYDNNGEETLLNGETDKKYLMGNEAKSAIDFILKREETDDFLKECQSMNKNVLLCMEKMRVENA